MATNGFLTTAEVAAELHRDRSVINKWVKAGKIKPAIEGDGVRGARFFRRSEVDRIKRELAERAA